VYETPEIKDDKDKMREVNLFMVWTKTVMKKIGDNTFLVRLHKVEWWREVKWVDGHLHIGYLLCVSHL
jgi:hypothetical protein